MAFMFYIVLATLLLAGLSVLFVRMDAKQVAIVLRYAVPVLLTVFGIVLTILGRASLAFGLFGLAAILFGRARARSRGTKSRNQTSHVRTAALEMELDLDTGAMNGLVLAGGFEGQELNDMADEDLLLLYRELQQDPESTQVLEAYLDRRVPTWRDGFEPNSDYGLGAAPSFGPHDKGGSLRDPWSFGWCDRGGNPRGASPPDETRAPRHRRVGLFGDPH